MTAPVGKSFFRSGVQTVTVRLFIVALGLAAGVITARWLGPEGVGILALLLLVKYVSFRFGNIGFGSALAFFSARRAIPVSRLIRIVYITTVAASGVCALVMLLVWRLDFSPWNDVSPRLYYIGVAAIPFYYCNIMFGRLLSGQLRITEMNAGDLITAAANALFVGIFVVAMNLGILGAALAALAADVLTFGFLASRFTGSNRSGGETETDASTGNPAIRMWRYGRWNYLLMISNFFAEELPMILLKVFSSNNSQVGWFSRARTVASYPRLATLPISQLLFPFTAASTPEDATRRTQILCRNWFSIMVVGVGLLAVFVKPIIVLLFGEEFLPSAAIFYALAPGVVFYPLLHFTEVHVAAAGKPKLVAGASFLTFVVAALSCWWLIPGHAAVGAGLSVSITYATGALLRLTVFKKITGSRISDLLVPRRSDWSYFKDIRKKLFSNTNRN